MYDTHDDIIPATSVTMAIFGIGSSPRPRVALLKLSGVIDSSGKGKTINMEGKRKAIDAVFATSKLSAVGLVIDSPGGSPGESYHIYHYIRHLSEKKKIPVYSFVEGIAASGGYMLACAGSEIYALPMSIVGSIGVICRGFGFTGLMEKIGVERRVYKAGHAKGGMDPFSAENPETADRVTSMATSMHQEFIALVRESRGTRINPAATDLFSGTAWTGREAATFGLVDGLGTIEEILRQKFGDKVDIVYPKKEKSGLFQTLSEGMSVSAALDAFMVKANMSVHYEQLGL